jgi:hypothetical protein
MRLKYSINISAGWVKGRIYMKKPERIGKILILIYITT